MRNFTFRDNIMRVKSDSEINMVTGFQKVVEHLSDCDVTHSFTCVEKTQEKFSGGFYYAWYTIKDYSFSVDKSVASDRKTEAAQSVIDYNIMMGNLADPEQEEN